MNKNNGLFQSSGCVGILLVLALSCTGREEVCWDEDGVRLAEVTSTRGQVHFTTNNGEVVFPLADGRNRKEPPKDTCWATLVGSDTTLQSRNDPNDSEVLGTVIQFRCSNEASSLFSNLVVDAPLIDLRLLDVGMAWLSDKYWCISCSYIGEPGNGCSHYSEPSLRVTVLEGQGSARPYPELVSDDFVRTVHVQLEMGRVSEGDEGVCAENIDILAEATFELRSSRYEATGKMTGCAP